MNWLDEANKRTKEIFENAGELKNPGDWQFLGILQGRAFQKVMDLEEFEKTGKVTDNWKINGG